MPLEQPKSTTSPKLGGVFLTSFAVFGVLMALWALASPLMAVPDEPAHAVRAGAVVRGELGNVSQVPDYIAATQQEACFASKPTVAANCQDGVREGTDRPVYASSSASGNGPLFYAVVGLPSLVLDGKPAIYAMRIVSGLLSAAFLAAAITALSVRRSSRWSVLAAIVAATPMMLFLGGSLNPNALEASSAIALFAGLVALSRAPRSHPALVGTVIVASTLFLSGTRSVSLLWILLIVAGALLLTTRRRLIELMTLRSVRITAALAVLVSVAAAAWFLWPRPATGDAAPPSFGGGRGAVLSELAERTFDYWNAWVGYFGWIDRPAPAVVSDIWLTCIVGLIVAGLCAGPVRNRLTTAYFLALALILPLAIQAALYSSLGVIWQGRYLLAIYGCLLVAAGIALDEAFPGAPGVLTVRIVRVVMVALGAAQVYAFVYILRSYVVATLSWLQMLLRPLWQPPLGSVVLTAAFAAVVAAGVFAYWRYGMWQVGGPLSDGARPSAGPGQPATASESP